MRKVFLNFSFAIFSILLFLQSVTISFAADASLRAIPSPVPRFVTLGEIITLGLTIVFGLVALFAVVMFTIGALRYLVSRGDPKAVDGARSTMTGSVIGFVIVLGAASLSGVFEKVFGISLFGTSNNPGSIVNGQFDLRCAFQLVTGSCIGTQFGSFGELVTQILRLLLAVGAVVFFFMLLWGGLRYILARGDEKAISDARSTLTNAVVGLLLMISALVIIRLIASVVFGIG